MICLRPGINIDAFHRENLRLFKYKHIRHYDIKCGIIAHAQGLMGEGVAFFLFQIDLLHSTGTEHIMYLAICKV